MRPLILLVVLLCAVDSYAANQDITAIQLQDIREFFPAADRLGNTDEKMPARTVLQGDKLLGYAFLTDQIKPIPAYSGKPVSTLIGLDLQARIVGTKIVAHEEPILVIGITETHLAAYIDQYRGKSALDRVRVGAQDREGYTSVDGITGATITVMVLNSSIMKSARSVAEHFGLPQPTEQQAGAAVPMNEEAKTVPDWQQLWMERSVSIGILLVALLLLMVILFFQDWLVVHTRLFHRVRVTYLLFTIFFIGFYCLAQLSIINVLAFVQLFSGGFTWETLLLDPIIFILWGFVAVSIILWGRGVYCGWLCPFGAIQELIHKVAEHFGWVKFEFPAMVHERLWAIKYLILILLVGVSLDSLVTAAQLAEVEPFKTTFIMHFDRQWWFVLYAVVLLVISAFNSKFFCKYLCPLGASLSFVTRFRIFDWLRRRKECGRPCQTCAAQCQIGAIKPTGEIIDNECHYCLECQVTYFDEHRCPPLVEKRKRREKRVQKAPVVIARTE
ncbi:MAG: 4Fe-4S binding protein [Pseudomonadales bacterium]